MDLKYPCLANFVQFGQCFRPEFANTIFVYSDMGSVQFRFLGKFSGIQIFAVFR